MERETKRADGLVELARDNVIQYCGVKVVFGPAVLEAMVAAYERYRGIQWEQGGRTWMDFTAFVNKLAVHGVLAYETVLTQVEADLNRPVKEPRNARNDTEKIDRKG